MNGPAHQPADFSFFKGKKVFITGHTGFKGSWLSLWLHTLGAEVTGYALPPPTDPSLFKLCRIHELLNSVIADVRDKVSLSAAMAKAQPEIIFHMAAQPLVRESYISPQETYEINVMGTVNLFEAVRRCKSVRAVINVTSDKCYENREWVWGYREDDHLGGYDPYSSSKACSEIVTAAYRSSFFSPVCYADHCVGLASARAGNVIGGGDWATDRLVPDSIRALSGGKKIVVRNPKSVRPWQHVLEPLSGYLTLAQRLCEDGSRFAQAWNFGPDDRGAKSVEWVVERICAAWGGGASYVIADGDHPHEAHYLKLDCSRARTVIDWRPRWNIEKAIESVVAWTKTYQSGGDVRAACLDQIEDFAAASQGVE